MNLPVRSDNTLCKYTFVGGYPLFYLDSRDSVVCRDCAQESLKDIVVAFQPIAYGINWEDPHMYCDNCSNRIESAYNEPEEEWTIA